MRQMNAFMTFQAAQSAGNYDERPMFASDVDMQLCLSRNDRPQPFYLICEHDSLLVNVSGEGRVEFPVGSARFHTLESGDFVYVPAGMPHRLVPDTPSVVFRFKASPAGLEGIAWYCGRCGAEVHREEWDTAVELSQEAYQRGCDAFNAGDRACACGCEHPRIDLDGTRWPQIAAELRAGA